ncbi:hypothetical protein TREMEDRAFT_45727 [Tremella mesenterica DSM 1558]|uniref:uncharacterized protein n=1 Tax=Tremella mesenterica (strain ATCC 24925 / CBS 8224 / DSM 1558 / NBRC 9311 / NRRL Y-6157 / RJB 2259-6 / UBC 559-6) TaxID=578456 RepID=UPI00032D65EA|nr:uncharacterized protein TREMEDRAFT_45727 [Tremella mesenterica DSM 1558]EIW66615.1 hypothetical protein TREMEDRAFT_45727 [Tremella mesenterica DSM 1558]
MGLLDKFKYNVHPPFQTPSTSSNSSYAQIPTIPLGPSLTPRYRKQRGVNLGSWFVLERWITEGPFNDASNAGKSDFDIASGDNAREVLEAHWDGFMSDEDWEWIVERGFNSVRLPIAYYHLSKPCPGAMRDTEFEPFARVFEGAWERILRAVEDAKRHGLGVLIDLHAAPGAQNPDSHSGTSHGRVKLFSRSNLRAYSLAIQFLASHFASDPWIVGLELLNEPRNDDRLQHLYETTLSSIRAIVGPEFPIYISDAWDTPWYASWVGRRTDFVVLDHHLYRCVSPQDTSRSMDELTHDLRHGFSGYFGGVCDTAKGSVVIGEFSATVAPTSLPNVPDGEKDRLRREYVKAQLDLYERCTAGWFFWTYKKGAGWDAGWSSKDAARAEILPSFPRKSFRHSNQQKQHELDSAFNSHRDYWACHGGTPDPESFRSGFLQGWEDAVIFLENGDELGFVGQWSRRRRQEQGRPHDAWEWEHGFKQGIEAAKRICQI